MAQNDYPEIPTEEFSSDAFYAKLGLDVDGTDADVAADRKAERLREWNESHR